MQPADVVVCKYELLEQQLLHWIARIAGVAKELVPVGLIRGRIQKAAKRLRC